MFLNQVWEITCQLAPWMILGTVIAGLLHVFLPANFLRHSLRGRSGVFKAVLLGVPLPLCSCGVIPTGIGLKKNGATNGSSVGFLISTPQTGVDSVLVSASFLGWPFAIFKIFAAAITGVIGGLFTDLVAADPEQEAVNDDTTQKRKGIADFFEHTAEILRSIWFWLVLGVFISALITEFVPETAFERINAWGILPALLLVLLISTPLYVCATASVPIAAALVAGGLPPSVALVFLMAGPATNIATITSIFGEFGWKTTATYLSTIVIGSIAFALLFDWIILIPESGETVAHQHHEIRWWEQVSALFLVAIFGWFAIQDGRKRYRTWFGRPRPMGDDAVQISVEGMTCENCVSKLEKSIRRVPGVEQVDVQLEPGQVHVRGDVENRRLEDAIEKAGFQSGTVLRGSMMGR